MSEEKFEYKAEDIFQDIPDDPDNVLMTIPPEILESQGWKEGDNLRIEWGDQGSIVITKIEESNE